MLVELVMTEEYVVGFDGGATKTEAIIAKSDGTLISSGVSGPSNYHVVGIDGAKGAILNSFEIARKKAGINIKKVKVAVAGLAGLDCSYDDRVLNSSIPQIGIAETFRVIHDSLNALYGATSGRVGVIVIAGTGSVAAGTDGKGNRVRVGGWGSILGDEGSAYFIGLMGLKQALKAFDGRVKETKLVEQLRKALSITETDEIIRKVYGEKMSVTEIASLAPIVTNLAKEGDEISIEIVRAAAEELAILAKTVILRLRIQNEKFPVATVGGVFKAGDIVLKPFSNSIQKLALNANVEKPRFGPGIGSVLIALEVLNEKITDEVLQNVEVSYKKLY
jgi:N-acetylglucosamine kinase-like BadF-type ATPase